MQYFFANRSISKPFPDVTEIQNPFLRITSTEKKISRIWNRFCRPAGSNQRSFPGSIAFGSHFSFFVYSVNCEQLKLYGRPETSIHCLKIEISENTAENFVQSQEHISCLLLLEYFFKTHTANGEVLILHGSTVEH